MPDEPKCITSNETPADFIRKEIERTKGNLQCAISGFGHSALKAANPVPWFKRYPVKSSIVAAGALAGGALFIAWEFRKKSARPLTSGPAVNVFVKKPKPHSKGWGQLGTALLTMVTARMSEGIRTTIANSFAGHPAGSKSVHSDFVPNHNLRDVQI